MLIEKENARRKKKLNPFITMNSGDPEKGMQMFNKATNIGLSEDLTTEEESLLISNAEDLIYKVVFDFGNAIAKLEEIKNIFKKLGIHSADIEPYMINKLEDMSNLEENSYDLNLCELYERLIDFQDNK